MTRSEWLYKYYGYDYIIEQRDGLNFTQFLIAISGNTRILRVYGTNQNSYHMYLR